MDNMVYLAGPISGLDYGSANDWREYAIEKLKPLIGLSPMRYKEYLLKEDKLKDNYPEHPLSTLKAITTRDRFDIQRCSIVLMNLLGAKKVSIGTMIEVGWADAYRKPIILAIEQDNIHNHSILNATAGFVVDTLDSGIDIAKALLL